MRVSVALKRAIWDMYIGMGVQKTFCPICGINQISNNVNSGFEAAHVVARRYFSGEMNVYYAYPSCSSCNNQCEDLCLLDFFYVRNNLHALRQFIMKVYQCYLIEHSHHLALEDRYSWRIIHHLYGPERFLTGGGIINTKAIYEIARVEELHLLTAEVCEVSKRLKDISDRLCVVSQTKILPMRLV